MSLNRLFRLTNDNSIGPVQVNNGLHIYVITSTSAVFVLRLDKNNYGMRQRRSSSA